MLTGDSSLEQSSAVSTPKETAARGSLITHIPKSKEISLCSSATAAQPLAGNSRFCPLSRAKSNPERQKQTLNNPHPDGTSSSSASTATATAAAAIFIANNDDLLTQILLYLPPKSLLRFQSVSWQWLAIIASPNFRSLYSRRHPTTTKALFLCRWKKNKSLDLNFVSFSDDHVNSMGNIISTMSNLFNNGEISTLHSCNGLLALVFKLDDYDDHREFVVYNPTTRQQRLIPQLCSLERTRHYVALNIVFDPLKSDYYKLLYVWWELYTISEENGLTEGRYGFSVYASETGIWRDSVDTLEMDDPSMHTYFEKGVLWNGDLHWISDWKYTFCFDLDRECLNWTAPNLPIPLGRWDFRYFGESGGSLYVIEFNDPGGVLFDIFELARDYSKWVLKYHVDLAPLKTLYPSMVDEDLYPYCDGRCKFYIPCFLDNEKEKKFKLVISLSGKIILYDIHDMIVKELAEVGPEGADGQWWEDYYQWCDAHQHVETLAYV